jgi:hypothetical protein
VHCARAAAEGNVGSAALLEVTSQASNHTLSSVYAVFDVVALQLAAYMLLVIFFHAYPAQDLMRRCHQSSFSSYTVADCRLLLIGLVL